MRAGKDSVADVLVRDHGFVKMSFAAPLKRMVKNLDPIVGVEVYQPCCDQCTADWSIIHLSDLYARGWSDDEIKASEYGPEARRMWQRFGTDVMRAEEDDYWIKAAWRDLYKLPNDARVVFTDCRFPNEAEFIYELNDPVTVASVWKVTRPGVELGENPHVSETWVGRMGEEFQVCNDGTLEELAEPVAIGVDYLTGKRDYPGSFQEPWKLLGYTDVEAMK
jgi:hypothetical protein